MKRRFFSTDGPARGERTRLPRGEAGFSLIEVVVALVVATLAVLGLAYSFSTGRTLIDRYELSRAALGTANGRMATLSMLSPTDPALSIGLHQNPFVLDGQPLGTEEWDVAWVDDPIDGTGGGDLNPNDLRRVSVSVYFQRGALTDTVRLTRLFPAP